MTTVDIQDLEKVNIKLEDVINLLKCNESCLEDLESAYLSFKDNDSQLSKASLIYEIGRNLPIMATLSRNIEDILINQNKSVMSFTESFYHVSKDSEVSNEK
ncbi:hypothetical protein M2S00_07310 [Apilactobacillus sp. TMW 2.2459]|uniref:hypothetical protein n=1 Tax=Apilactobacillus xinyiensis TaxID=2841032 RepID=UPI00200E542E|nr:hypothetical protein [Apilactobacillus xinyiensis]MCL0312914.1 hypothetical protein [Apilactobacillus xinyiensis]